MKRMVLAFFVLSLFGATAAGAFPAPLTEQGNASAPLVQVGSKVTVHKHGHNYKHGNNYKHGHNYKHHYKHDYKYAGKYHYGNRYWNYRYTYRPLGWQAWGCIAVGPFWYCP
jgi:hypothetical protein